MRSPRTEAGCALVVALLAAAAPAVAALPTPPARESRAAAAPAGFETYGLPGPLRRRLVNRYFDAYDLQQGGLLRPQKTLDPEHLEYALFRAQLGDEISASRARQTLDAARALQDPEDGGFSSHSFGDWTAPTGEKSAQVQAEFLRSYALAALLWPDAEYLAVARDARDYLRHLLPAETAAETGWAIEALTLLYRAGRDPADAELAIGTARWLLANRALPGGGIRQRANDAAALRLEDSLAAGAAFLALYRVTGKPAWLQQATTAADFMVRRFRHAEAGYHAGAARPAVLGENIRLARFFNLLAHAAGRTDFLDAAQHAMRFVSRPEPLGAAFELSGALLADDELGRDPLRFTIVGARDDPAARDLLAATLAVPGTYQRLDWWDPRQPPANADLPLLSRATLYACAGSFCTPPIHEPEQLPRHLLQLSGIPD